jgi:hypothetical protein
METRSRNEDDKLSTEPGQLHILRDGTVGQAGKPAMTRRFESIHRAVAEYVMLELDFWSGVSATV